MNPIPWIINCGDPTGKGLLESVSAETLAQSPEFIRRDGRLIGLRFVTRNGSPSGILFNDVSFDAASDIEVAIGTPDAAPTSGTFSLSYNGDSTGLTGLAWNIAASALAALMNLNPAISAAGGVAVTGATLGGQWLVSFNTPGARFTFAITDNTLQPPTNEDVQIVVDGDGSTNEVQLITLRQGYLAYQNTWNSLAAGSLSITQVQTGSASQPSIQRVEISDTVKGGVFSLQAFQAQIISVNVSSNQATQATYTFNTSGVVGTINDDYIDFYDRSGIVRMWFDVSSTGTPPATPTGGRLLEVNTTGTTAAEVAAGIYTAVLADAEFTNVILSGSGTQVDFSLTDYGPVTSATPNVASTGITGSGTNGNYGRLDQTSFIISGSNGTVGVWVNLSDDSTPPAALDDVYRLIQVTGIAPNATASTAATAIAAAVDADAEFSASAVGATITITGSIIGIRLPPVQNTPLLGVTETQTGYALAGSFGINATSGDMQNVFGDVYNVTKTDTYTWEFVAIQNGAQAAITGTSTGLLFAEFFTGNLELNNWNMLLAFNATEANEIDTTLEVQVTEPGQPPVKVLNIPVTVRRDVIDVASVVSPTPSSEVGNVFFQGSVTGYIGGGGTNLDGVATTTLGVPRLVSFTHATHGQRWYILRAGTDAEASPGIIRPDDYNGASNAKVWQSVS